MINKNQINSEKRNLLLLFLVLILFIAVRFPIVNSETGKDSFLMHNLAQSIIDNGDAKWIIHPFSLIGFYPLSYPAGVHYILATISTITGMDMESTIFFYCIFLALLGSLGMGLLLKEFPQVYKHRWLAISLFGIGALFVTYTNWTITTRGQLMALFPYAIWILLRLNSKIDFRNITISLLILATGLMTHRAGMFMIVLLTVFVLFKIVIKIQEKFELLDIVLKQITKAHILVPIMLVLFFLQFTDLPFFNLLHYSRRTFTSFLFENSQNPMIIFINIMIHFIVKSSGLFLIAVLGLIIFSYRKKDSNSVLLLLMTASLFSFTGMFNYMFVPFYAFIIFYTTYLMSILIEKTTIKRIVPAATIIIVALFSVFYFNSNLMNIETDNANYAPTELRSVSHMINTLSKEAIIWAESYSVKINSLTDNHIRPFVAIENLIYNIYKIPRATNNYAWELLSGEIIGSNRLHMQQSFTEEINKIPESKDIIVNLDKKRITSGNKIYASNNVKITVNEDSDQ